MRMTTSMGTIMSISCKKPPTPPTFAAAQAGDPPHRFAR